MLINVPMLRQTVFNVSKFSILYSTHPGSMLLLKVLFLTCANLTLFCMSSPFLHVSKISSSHILYYIKYNSICLYYFYLILISIELNNPVFLQKVNVCNIDEILYVGVLLLI